MSDESSAWRHVIDKTSPNDFWQIVKVFRQLQAKFGARCKPEALLRGWSQLWCTCCDGCGCGCRGLVGALMRATLLCGTAGAGVCQHQGSCSQEDSNSGCLGHACSAAAATPCWHAGARKLSESWFDQHAQRDKGRCGAGAQGGGGCGNGAHRLGLRQDEAAPCFQKRSGKREFVAFANDGNARLHPSFLAPHRLVIPTMRELHLAIGRLWQSLPRGGASAAGPTRGRAARPPPGAAGLVGSEDKGSTVFSADDLRMHILKAVDEVRTGTPGWQAQADAEGEAGHGGGEEPARVVLVGQLQARSGRIVLADDTGHIGLVVPEEEMQGCDCLSSRASSAAAPMDTVLLRSWTVVLDACAGQPAPDSRCIARGSGGAPERRARHALGEPYLQVCCSRRKQPHAHAQHPTPTSDGQAEHAAGACPSPPCNTSSPQIPRAWSRLVRPRACSAVTSAADSRGLEPLLVGASGERVVVPGKAACAIMVQHVVPPAPVRPGDAVDADATPAVSSVALEGLVLVKVQGDARRVAGGALESVAASPLDRCRSAPQWAPARVVLLRRSATVFPFLHAGGVYGLTDLALQQHGGDGAAASAPASPRPWPLPTPLQVSKPCVEAVPRQRAMQLVPSCGYALADLSHEPCLEQAERELNAQAQAGQGQARLADTVLQLLVGDSGHVFPVHASMLQAFPPCHTLSSPPGGHKSTTDFGTPGACAAGQDSRAARWSASDALVRDTRCEKGDAGVGDEVAEAQRVAHDDGEAQRMVSFRGVVLSSAWRYSLPSSGGAPCVKPYGASHAAAHGAPIPLHAYAASKQVLLLSLARVTWDSEGEAAAAAASCAQFHVYIDAQRCWIPRGLVPGALVACRRVLLQGNDYKTPLKAAAGMGASAPSAASTEGRDWRADRDLACWALPETQISILRTATADWVSAAGGAGAPYAAASLGQNCHAEVRIGDLDAVAARDGVMMLVGSLTSIWKVSIEMVCPACQSVAPPSAEPAPCAISCEATRQGQVCKEAPAGGPLGAAARACVYSLVVKAEGRFEDGTGFCRAELEGAELVLGSLLRLSPAAVRQLLAAAFQSGRLAFHGGVQHEDAVRHAQACCALVHARPLPPSSARSLSDAVFVLSTAVHDALASGKLAMLRIWCEQVLAPRARARECAASLPSKKVFLPQASAAFTANRPQASSPLASFPPSSSFG